MTLVFNNAGVRLVRPFVQYTQAQIEKMISVNLMGQVGGYGRVHECVPRWTRVTDRVIKIPSFQDVGAARLPAPAHQE